MKSCENEFKIVFQYKYHHWMFRNVFFLNFDKYRGLWVTVHHCAKRKKTSIICVANLHSLPWNTTSKAHKIRTTLKRRWIFKRASGNRCLHDAGKTRPPRKAAAAAAAAAAIPCQYLREQSQITEKEWILREDKMRTTILGWQTCRKHSFEILIFKYVYSDTTVDVTGKKREQRTGMLNVQYWERRSVQNHKIN